MTMVSICGNKYVLVSSIGGANKVPVVDNVAPPTMESIDNVVEVIQSVMDDDDDDDFEGEDFAC